MCLIALAIGSSPAWPLVIAGNRDEFFARPTLPLARWRTPSGATIVSGRDLEAGGTWMGITPEGRVALLTNVREPAAQPGARSRGELPLSWLQGREDADGFLAGLRPQDHSGFNLVIGDVPARQWHWVSNRQPDRHGKVLAGWQHQRLGPGVYGLSNAFLDTPWPKTLKLREALSSALAPALDPAVLWQALADGTPAPDAELPRTGVGPEAEKQLSSAFVRFANGQYGTRVSTVLAAGLSDQGLAVQMQEKTWLPEGGTQLREERLLWPA